MNFSKALYLLKRGYKLSRQHWQNKWLEIDESRLVDYNGDYTKPASSQTHLLLGWIDSVRKLEPYQPTHSDLFANDWVIV